MSNRANGIRYDTKTLNSNRATANRAAGTAVAVIAAMLLPTAVARAAAPADPSRLPDGGARAADGPPGRRGHAAGEGRRKGRTPVLSQEVRPTTRVHRRPLRGRLASPMLSQEVPRPTTHNVILRAVYVTPEWQSFDDSGGWSSAVMVRQSENLKYFEAAIWVEERAIHLYEFDNSFDPFLLNDRTPEQWVAHRESYRVMRAPGLPLSPPDDPYSPQLSLFIREAFKDFASYIVSRYPDSEHHLSFHGHGAPGGRLFEYRLSYEDTDDMLTHWTAALGRPLGVIDMGGPCTKGGYEDLTNFCRHARFYIASDMPNGGYKMDDWTFEKHKETSAELQYHRLFAETGGLREALVGRVNLRRQHYEYARENIIQAQWMQATYLYSCQEFEPFSRQFLAFLNDTAASWRSRQDDMLEFLETNGAGDALTDAFRRVISHKVDNSDFFEWPEDRNGVLMPAPWWSPPPIQ